MIHSMAGGVVHQNRRLAFAKVQLEDGQVRFYISKIADLKQGDIVLVPGDNFFAPKFSAEGLDLGFEDAKQQKSKPVAGLPENVLRGVVLRVDKNVNEQVSPVPVKRCKEILQKIQ